MTQLKLDFEKSLLSSQLEIQEQTFQHISREIHDNISLSLTLAKLHLNTFDWTNKTDGEEKLNSSIELLSKSIAELSDISKSLNADIILQLGLLKAIENEIEHIRQTNLFAINYVLTGTEQFLDNQKELIIFRIIQEAFNNIIKHSSATTAGLLLHYCSKHLKITIEDDGKGFDPDVINDSGQAGLNNMQSRTKILKGEMKIQSKLGSGTTLTFTIPTE